MWFDNWKKKKGKKVHYKWIVLKNDLTKTSLSFVCISYL